MLIFWFTPIINEIEGGASSEFPDSPGNPDIPGHPGIYIPGFSGKSRNFRKTPGEKKKPAGKIFFSVKKLFSGFFVKTIFSAEKFFFRRKIVFSRKKNLFGKSFVLWLHWAHHWAHHWAAARLLGGPKTMLLRIPETYKAVHMETLRG